MQNISAVREFSTENSRCQAAMIVLLLCQRHVSQQRDKAATRRRPDPEGPAGGLSVLFCEGHDTRSLLSPGDTTRDPWKEAYGCLESVISAPGLIFNFMVVDQRKRSSAQPLLCRAPVKSSSAPLLSYGTVRYRYGHVPGNSSSEVAGAKRFFAATFRDPSTSDGTRMRSKYARREASIATLPAS